MAHRRITSLAVGGFLALSVSLLAVSGTVLASSSGGSGNAVQPAAPAPTDTPTPTATPVPPSDPSLTCGGTVGFTGVPAGWYLIIEPGDHLYTSGFDSIPLAPGDYVYQFRDANANDTVGGKFTIEVCPTATAFQSVGGATGTPPTTSTGTSAPSSNSTPLFALLISFAFGGLGLTAVAGQRRKLRR
jgi:hypothetical protein